MLKCYTYCNVIFQGSFLVFYYFIVSPSNLFGINSYQVNLSSILKFPHIKAVTGRASPRYGNMHHTINICIQFGNLILIFRLFILGLMEE